MPNKKQKKKESQSNERRAQKKCKRKCQETRNNRKQENKLKRNDRKSQNKKKKKEKGRWVKVKLTYIKDLRKRIVQCSRIFLFVEEQTKKEAYNKEETKNKLCTESIKQGQKIMEKTAQSKTKKTQTN